MKLPTLLLFFFLAGTSVANSLPQENTVTGTVTNAATGEPLPRVNVLIENTLTGVSTDLNGKFSLPKPAEGAIIIFSFIGYTTERITFSGQPVIDVMLSITVQEIEDVVVTGYGTIKRTDMTGAIASVGAGDIEKSSPANIQSALQGHVAGLLITNNSGSPGNQAVVFVRGVGTVNNNAPIYVVDGMIIDPKAGGNMNYLNPADVERVEVLKDASAQAIYGSRGANGVILITTKKGSEGLPKVTFSSTIGFQNAFGIPEVLDREEFMDYIREVYSNGYIRANKLPPNTVIPLSTLIDAYPTVKNAVKEYNDTIYTNWTDEILRKNVLNQNYNFSLSGGTKYAHYMANAGYLNTDGLIKNYNFRRYAFRLNTDFRLGDFITAGENLGITNFRRSSLDPALPFRYALWADPMFPVLKPEGSVDPDDPDYMYNKYAASLISGVNPALDVELQKFRLTFLTMTGNIFAEAAFLRDFKLRSGWGFNISNQYSTDFIPRYKVSSGIQNSISTVSESAFFVNGWIWENTLTYNKVLQDHSLTALLGFTSEYSKTKSFSATKQTTPSNEPEMQTFSAATTQPNVTGGYEILTMESWISRLNYSFKNKYLTTLTLRGDGSSKFGQGNRWGVFPSFSLGWRLGNEEFFKNLNIHFINDIKFRAGWGQIGNSSIPVNYAYISQVSSAAANRYIFGEQVVTGYFLSRIGNPDISWETTDQTNVGLDLIALKNALTVTADFYIKDINEMLLQGPYPDYSGYPYSAAPFTNAGSVQNKGLEFVISYKGQSGKFTYDISVDGSMFRNNVTSTGAGNKPIMYPVSRTEVGHPIAGFYGYVTDGIFQTEEDVKNHTGGSENVVLQKNALPGDFRFRNLNNDTIIDAYDQTWIGNPWPDLTYGIKINLGYKNFDLNLLTQGTIGNDIYRWGLWRHFNFTGSQNEYKYIYKNGWRGPGSSNSQPLLTTYNNNNNFRHSDYFVEDGSYWRLKYLQIGYNLPDAICSRLKMKNLRIWIGGSNLLTFTKYTGNDPEVGANATPVADAGIDYDTLFPKYREITLGISISL
jgi:TonB-linked SusC/RagA family outer membrane protein